MPNTTEDDDPSSTDRPTATPPTTVGRLDSDRSSGPPSDSIDFAGVFPALPTPFADDGTVDHETLAADACRLAAAGVDGVVPAGSTGESATLTHDEHVAAIETVAESVDVPILAGAGSNATHEAVSLSRRAVAAGADALLHISPYYNRPEQRGLADHYRTVAECVDVPVVLYDVPSRTGRAIAVDTIVELADHPGISGLKAASGDLSAISAVVERTPDSFAVFSGDDGLTLPICSVGGVGAISVVANLEPERVCALVGAALAGDYDRARRLHRELGPLSRALFAETNPIPVVEARRLRGLGPGNLRPPLTRLAPAERERLAAVLDELDADDPAVEVAR